MLTLDVEHCTGCGACVQICPVGCINWVEGEFGFRYPRINDSLCINCRACERTCPIDKTFEIAEHQDYLAAVNNNLKELEESTSGGVFSACASWILQHSGIVYGCEMGDDFKVKHIRVDKEGELIKLRGSKYVQSYTGETFKDVKADLIGGKYVLFSGTPSQISGLKLYLNEDYEKLFTIDIICHGVSSQKYFEKYISYIADAKGAPVSLKFRDKKYVGWSCGGTLQYIDKKTKAVKEKPLYNHDSFYYHYFLSGSSYRKSCYSCPYANTNRLGDITLGDFWGAESLKLGFNIERGCSLVILNSEKGKKMFYSLQNVCSKQVSVDNAVKKNEQLNHAANLPDERDILSNQYLNYDGQKIQDIYLKKNKSTLLKGKIKKILPYRLKLILRGWG